MPVLRKSKMEFLAELLVNWLIRKKVVSYDDKELYVYSAYSIILTLSPMIITMIIGIIVGKTLECFFLIVPFMILRKTAGGIHLKSHILCVISSIIILCFYMKFAELMNKDVTILVIAVISSAVILVLSPVDSENRKLDKEEIIIAKRSIKKIILILLGVLFILYFGLRKLSSYFSSGILLTASLQLPVIFCKIRKRLPNDKNMI